MFFVPGNYIIESISLAIQDVIFVVGNKYGKYTEISPDIPTQIKPGVYKASKDNWIYLSPELNDDSYYLRISSRFKRSDSTKDFNIANLNDTAIVLPPNHIGVRLDYKNGLIYKSGSVSESIKLVYCYKTIKTLTTWPEKIEDAELPAISILESNTNSKGFAIGTDQKEDRHNYEIHIFAESDGQRSEIDSLLRQAFKVGIIPLFDFRHGEGYPLTQRLEKNTGFDATTQLLCYLRVEEFSTSILPPLGTIKAERHRAVGNLTVSLIN